MKLGRREKFFFTQFFLLCLAFSLRLYRLDYHSLWADEGNSVAMALRDFSSIALHSAADIHPPLYYWFLKLWTTPLGISEWALRALSAFIGTVLVALIYALGKELWNEKIALTGMALATFHPFQVYYSQEARMYILVALLGALSFWGALKWLRKESLWAGILFVLATALGLYTHYSFPILLMAENLAFLLFLSTNHPRKRARVRGYIARWLLLQVLPFVIYAPWIPTALSRLTSWPAIAEYGVSTALWETLKAIAFGPASGLPAIATLAVGLVPIIGSVLHRKENWQTIVALWAWLLAPVFMMIFLGLFRGAYLKFLLLSSPPFCLLLALSINDSGGLRRILGAFFLAGLLFSFSTALRDFYFYFTKDDYRSIARYIEATEKPGDVIILNAPGQIDVFRYYYKGKLPVWPLPRERPPDRHRLEEELAIVTSHPGRIFAILWGEKEADPEGIVENWLERHSFKVGESWRGNVRFAIYMVPEKQLYEKSLEGKAFGSPALFRLTGCLIGAQEVESGNVLPVILTWQAERSTTRRYKVTLQLLNSNGLIASQYDAEPEGGRRPTSFWEPGDIIIDNIGLLVRPGTPPGQYTLILAVYDAETGERLPVLGKDHLTLENIKILKPSQPPPIEALGIVHRRNARFGPFELLGYDLFKLGFEHLTDAPIGPGDIIRVNLYWQALLKPQEDWFVELNLVGGNKMASVKSHLAGIDYPTSRWEEKEIVRGQFALQVPPDAPPGQYRLFLKIKDLPPLELATVRVKG
ncbi:MAG: glycosyltransferase family 39 protein [Anaerolineae bacterium]|nr:glycosyltransferase family 39 protein [Anaerolineae bacterium]